MAENLHSNVPVHIRHFPDEGHKEGSHDPNEMVALPGIVEVGVEVDGVWIPLLRRKASGVLADLKRGQQSQPPPPPSNG